MKTILCLLAGLCVSAYLHAQTINHMDVFVQDYSEQNITINGNDTLISITSLKEPQMFLVLNDTNNISSFTVKLGTTTGGNEIIEKTFSFADEGQFPDGTSYTRDGLYVRLFLGKYTTLNTYYASVRATASGSQQSAVSYSGQ